MKLLLVDDHSTFRIVAARMLTLLGHEVVDAGDALEAETLFLRATIPFDAIVVDVFLGETDGVTLVKRLAASSRGVRVLFMSGDIEATSRMPGAQGPRRVFVQKPFSSNEIQEALEALLRT